MSLIHEIGAAVLAELLAPATRTTSANGSAVDVTAYEGSLLATVHSAAGTGTNPTLDVKLQDSADGSTDWQDVTGAVFAQIDDTAGGSIQGIQVDKGKCRQYVRAVATIAGTTPSFLCAVAIAGLPKYR